MEWISVKDKMPKIASQRYLCYCDGGLVRVGYYWWHDGSRTKAGWQMDAPFKSFEDYDYNVTHWMPLPSPPKE